jgi:Fe-Mn family superoxide dismutase
MHIHHDKHHAAYIKNLNDALVGNEKLLSMPIDDLIRNLTVVPEVARTKVRNNGGGHANHSLFWTVMASPKNGGGGQPSGALKKAIDAAFGGFAQFQEKFTAAGIGRFGSGWVWLIADSGKLVIADTPNQDSPLMEGRMPILGLDVWEHAYYLKYQNVRADYIKAWWSVVNWKEVGRRFDEAVK